MSTSLPAPVTAQQSTQNESIFKLSAHPVALAFFLLFRVAAILTYLLGLIFTSNFIFIFVIIVLLLAFDFWTVKNVAGRLLVGLRWWNETSPQGASIWVFESADPQKEENSTDRKVFWAVLYATPAIWVALAFVAILKFEFVWLTLVIIALVLSGSNALAYTRCDKDSKKQWATNMANNAASSGFVSRMAGLALSRAFGG